MSPPSCPAGRSRPAPWSASTCRSPPPCSARATTPSPRTWSGRRPDGATPAPVRPDGAARPGARPLARRPSSPTARAAGRFRVEAWSDPLATWRHAVEVKIEAGQGAEDLANDLEDGARLLDRVAARGRRRAPATGVAAAAAALRDTSPGADRPDRPGAGRRRCSSSCTSTRCASWSPARPSTRSGSTGRGRSTAPGTSSSRARRARSSAGTARPTARSPTPPDRLPAIADMGFDVVYLPPIHPIGTVNRKGPNTTVPGGNRPSRPDDVGSPWAIGSDEGGHDAVHPQLGTMEDFRAFVARTRELGMEVALDLALQAAPDHPWVDRAPGVVHHQARRHDRLRGEPAEEVPGHLPDQLRQRPRGHLRRVPAGRPACGSTPGCGSSASTTRTPSR